MTGTKVRKGGSLSPSNYQKASAYNIPKQWEIWLVDQANSRANSIPPVPSDPTKPYRLFIVISPDDRNTNGADVVVLPISSHPFIKTFEVCLRKGVGNVLNDSYIKCHHPQSIFTDFLYGPFGKVDEAQLTEDVQEKLKDYLEIP